MSRVRRRMKHGPQAVLKSAPVCDAGEVLSKALALHASGILDKAERGYRHILATNIRHPDALHLLGMAAYRRGQFDRAIEIIGRAIRLDRISALFHLNLGNALHQIGRRKEAADALLRAILLNVEDAAAQNNLAVLFTELGRPEEAADCCGRSVRLQPGSADAHCNMGNALRVLGRLEEAVTAYDRAIQFRDGYFLAHFNRAVTLAELGRAEQAVISFRIALSLNGTSAETWLRLGLALRSLGRWGPAASACQACAALKADEAPAYNLLGTILKEMGASDAALGSYCRALRLDPDLPEANSNIAAAYVDRDEPETVTDPAKRAVVIQPGLASAYSSLGIALSCQGALEEGDTLTRRAVRIEPGSNQIRANAAQTLFCLGRMRDGWLAYEARMLPPRPTTMPRWDGQPAPGKTLLIWREQGIADQLLAVSMVPDAVRAMGKVVLECERRLVSLLARSFPEVTVVAEMGLPDPRAEAADYHIPAFSLGRHFRNRPADFPAHQGYLRADPARIAYWKDWLGALGPGPKIGFSWRGMRAESTPVFLPSLDRLQPALMLSGMTFVNLQYGKAEKEISAFHQRTGCRIHLADGLDVTNDLDEVAALICALDGVTGTSTTASILAAALGQPTLMYAYRLGANGNRFFGLDHIPWLPSARIIPYGYQQDLDVLVGLFADQLGQFVASLV